MLLRSKDSDWVPFRILFYDTLKFRFNFKIFFWWLQNCLVVNSFTTASGCSHGDQTWSSSRWWKDKPQYSVRSGNVFFFPSAGPSAVADPNLPPLWQWPFPSEDLAHPSNRIVCQSCCFHKMLSQARQNPIGRQSCPIAGTYLGQLPDAPGLCARLVSNCDKRWDWENQKQCDGSLLESREMMFYSVSDCDNSTNIYEGSAPKFRSWFIAFSSSFFISLASSICPQAVLFCSIC